MKKAILMLAAALAVGSCANVTDVETLDLRLRQQEQRINELEAEVGQLEESQEPTASKTAEMYSDLQTMREDLAELQGRTMQMERRMTRLEARQGNATQALADTNERLDELEQEWIAAASQMGLDYGEAAAMPAENATAPLAANATLPADAGEQAPEPEAAQGMDLYDRARQEFEKRNYERALEMWGEFVEANPEHKMAPNALFWQGESYYQMRDYARAVLKYQEVIDNYKDSVKYRAALLKQGISFMRLGRVSAGKLLLRDVVEKFPDTPEARRAKIILSGEQ